MMKKTNIPMWRQIQSLLLIGLLPKHKTESLCNDTQWVKNIGRINRSEKNSLLVEQGIFEIQPNKIGGKSRNFKVESYFANFSADTPCTENISPKENRVLPLTIL